jgi:hypothetical protein
MRWLALILILVIGPLVACGSGSGLDPNFVAGGTTLPDKDRLGVHVHPSTPNLIASVEDAMSVSDTIRMQIDFQSRDADVPGYVIDVVETVGAADKQLILVLTLSQNMRINNPDRWELETGLFFSKLLTLLKNNPLSRNIVFEIGNEPDLFCAGNQQFNFPDFVFPNCSMDDYIEYVRVVRGILDPQIFIENSLFDGNWQTMLAATIPWHQSPRIEMNTQLLASEHTQNMIFNLHIYDTAFHLTAPLVELYATAKQQGREVWVTETGATERQLKFMKDTYSVMDALGMTFEKIVIYAYNDDTLGFSLVDMTGPAPRDTDLMTMLRERG